MHKLRPVSTLLLIASVLASALADGHGLPAVDPLDYPEAEIIIAGSSTVFPLSERMAELWTDAGGGAPSIASIGSGAGFERFCVEGETDISNASRAINDSERESCREIGRDPIEFRIGTDALAVTVSAENDFARDITLDELALIFSSADSWSDVRADWPDEAIQRFIPGTDSGSFDYFVEEVFDKDKAAILGANPQLSEDDNLLAQGITGSPYAIGFFGYAYYEANRDSLTILSIDGIEANEQTTDDGSYPLARPLYIYSDAGIMREKPQVNAFINFYLTHVNDEVFDVGYFPASAYAFSGAIDYWRIANGLTPIGDAALDLADPDETADESSE